MHTIPKFTTTKDVMQQLKDAGVKEITVPFKSNAAIEVDNKPSVAAVDIEGNPVAIVKSED